MSPPATKKLGYAIGFVIVLAAIYVGAYFAMVEAHVRVGEDDAGVGAFVANPEYRLGGTMLEALFYPMHQLDRRFRPRMWQSLALKDVLPYIGPPGKD